VLEAQARCRPVSRILTAVCQTSSTAVLQDRRRFRGRWCQTVVNPTQTVLRAPISEPGPRTSDHIRPFFWVPSDTRLEALPKVVEENVKKCWEQLASPKNGGYEPAVQPRGWSWDKLNKEYVWNEGTRLRITTMRLDVPPGHAYFKEGYDAYIMRYQDHSPIRFQRKRMVRKPFWLPDHIAADLAVKGLFAVSEYDTADGRVKEEEIREEQSRPKKKRSGRRRRTEVPMSGMDYEPKPNEPLPTRK